MIEMKIDEIVVPNNRTIMGDDDLNDLSKNIGEHGILVPILVDPNNVLIDGYRRYVCAKRQGFDPVPVTVAMSYDAPASVIQYAESRHLPFGVAIDNTGVIAQRFGDVEMTPTSVLINKRGEIVKRFVGEPDFAALEALVERLLAEA